METCDVLIVGGGPAGSSCAWKLRQSGLQAIVIDKAQFPRHKVCGGWITPQILSALMLDVEDYQRQRTIQPITRFLTAMIGGPEVETTYGQTVSYGIRRCEFDDYLLRRSGARLQLGEPFHAMRRDGDGWVVNDQYRARVVVGAGGHFCPVARQLEGAGKDKEPRPRGADPRGLPVVLAQEVEFEMTEDQQSQCTIARDRPELFFCPDLKGYGWVFRKENFLNIGLGREGEEHLSQHIGNFVEFLQSRGKVRFPLTSRFQGHAYCLRTRLNLPPNEPGVLLIGDAVGLADSRSGEGIRPAIESGLMAAAAILESGLQSTDQLHKLYSERLQNRFSPGSAGSLPIGWIPSAVRQFAARRLMASRWFARRVLLDRWFLHPALAPLATA